MCGSLQAWSANLAVLDIASTGMIDAGAIVDRYGELDRVPPLNADLGDAGEAVRNWRASIEAADAVVVASPEYAGSLAGVVKNALD